MFGDCTESKDNQVNCLLAWAKEREEKTQKIISEIYEESDKGKLIIVEGKKDAQALRELGFNGRILEVKTGGKYFLDATAEIERVAAGEVILLLDFDRRGVQGTQRLKENLERTRIKVNTRFWQNLQYLVGRKINCIESLTSYLQTLQDQISNL